MLRSMTAYGRAVSHNSVGRFVIEIQSVNRKFLEISVQLPPELSSFELEMKKWILPFLHRGQVSVKVSAFFEEAVPLVVRPNLALAHQLKEAWEIIAKQTGVEEPFSLSLLSNAEGILQYNENEEDEEIFREILKKNLEIAFDSFLRMKKQEGAVLQQDLVNRLGIIQRAVREIEAKTPQVVEKYRNKLLDRLKNILPSDLQNDERILREIALFSEKVDIAEEITRLDCHLKHFFEVMEGESVGIGKTLEFIVQELNREINTVGSKSADSTIARLVIDVKSELERIKEQIQNVE